MVNQAGVIQSQQYYHPYGDARSALSTLTTKRFTGQYHEEALGLYFYGARWYDPLIGRFTQADTLIPDPGDPQSLNRYSYVGNNPLRYVDPGGHSFRDADESNTCGTGEDCSTGEEIDELYDFVATYGCNSVSPTGLCTDASGNYIPNPVNDAAAAGELNVWGGILATLWEPADWAATFGRWWHGDFSYWDLAGLLPLVPASGCACIYSSIFFTLPSFV